MLARASDDTPPHRPCRAAARWSLSPSQELIRALSSQAEDWDLRFEGISDLATTGGPFASVFYTKAETPDDERFIVLCFKGTVSWVTQRS